MRFTLNLIVLFIICLFLSCVKEDVKKITNNNTTWVESTIQLALRSRNPRSTSPPLRQQPSWQRQFANKVPY